MTEKAQTPLQKADYLDRHLSAQVALPLHKRGRQSTQYLFTRGITHLGDSWLWGVIAAWLWFRTDYSNHPAHHSTVARERVLGWFSSLMVATGLALAVKNLIQRPRPAADRLLYGAGPDRHSFPSGHAMRMGVITVWASLYKRPTGLVISVIAFFVCWSRVRLGIHYLGDIAAGLIMGAAIGAAGRYWRTLYKDAIRLK